MSTCAKPSSSLDRRLGRPLFVGLALLFVPVLYGAELAIAGVPSARGCSPIGGAAPNGINSFRVQRDAALEQVAVANDGFFVIEVGGIFATPEDLLASIAVEVTSANGVPQAGSLHPFPSSTGLYWLADAPLEDGSYTATVSSPANAALGRESMKLEAQGAPSKLTLPSVEPRKWLEYHRLSGGTQLTCAVAGLCEPLQFGELEESSPGVDLRVSPSAPINGRVYWEAHVQSANVEDAKTLSSTGGALQSAGSETGGELRFAQARAEYCVVVTVIDRRDDQQLTSAPICWKPGPLEVVDETNVIASCPEPPSAALLPSWCRYHQDSNQCRDIPGDVTPPGNAGAAGSVGSAGNGGKPGSSANAGAAGLPSSGPSPEAHDAGDDNSSSACSIGHSRSASSLGSFALLALAALGLRRKLSAGA